MPSANDAGSSNGLLQKWEDMYAREAALVEARAKEALAALHGGSETPSAGTSSSTSESTPDKSGSSLQASESSLQSPVPTAENPSEADPAAPPAPSSTASSTDGSTQETGASPAGQPDSSEASPAKTEPTPARTDEEMLAAAEALVDDARKAYNDKKYELANDLINEAEKLYPNIVQNTKAAHDAIDAALAATTATNPS